MFLFSQLTSWIQTNSFYCPQYLCLFCISLSATQINMVKKWCWFSQINVFHKYLPQVVQILFLSCHFDIVHIHRRIILSLLTKKHSQFGTFSHSFSNITFLNCLSHTSLGEGWPYWFRSRGTTVSSILDHDLGHFCRGRRIQMSGHSDFGILIWEQPPFLPGF